MKDAMREILQEICQKLSDGAISTDCRKRHNDRKEKKIARNRQHKLDTQEFR